MQTLNKIGQIASLQGKDRLERLIAYRSTPHPATGIAPYEATRGAAVRTKLDRIDPKPQTSEKDDVIDQRDTQSTNRR